MVLESPWRGSIKPNENQTSLSRTEHSWHTAVMVGDHTMLVYGGFDGDKALNDAYLLDLGMHD